MKKTLLKIITASLCFALPLTIASCDGSDSSPNSSNSDFVEDENIDDNDDNTTGDADCLAGQTYQFIGEQTTTTETTTPIASTSTAEANFDLTIEFMADGVSRVTGTLDFTKITVTVAGISTDVTTGLGTTDIDAMGTYTCTEDSPGSGEEVTVSRVASLRFTHSHLLQTPLGHL